jgi:spore germination protein GerM
VAYIDFSEDFGFNSYGLIGYQIQVYQVVYTAAQFATVDAVYFYMEGEPLEYLGGEGYLLHNPVYPFSYLPEYSL